MGKTDDATAYSFPEEPIGIPAAAGYGFFQGGPGALVGADNRYKLAGKLGFGTTSSVWLAMDNTQKRYVAVKILNGDVTKLNDEKKLRELLVMQRLSSVPQKNPHFTRLLDNFYHPGAEGDGEHLCLVTELRVGLDVVRKRFPEPLQDMALVKQLLRHVLLGLSALHSVGVAHTDIKPDNILVDFNLSNSDVDDWLKKHPPRAYKPVQSFKGLVTCYASESFLPTSITVKDIQKCSFELADFGSAQIIGDQTTDHITPLDLRPPEIVLGGPWNQAVDIWSFGCLAFHLLTGGSMFGPFPIPERHATIEDTLLFQMMCYTGENFRRDFLCRCRRSLDYFKPDLTLQKFGVYVNKSLPVCVREGYGGVAPEEDVQAIALLLARCLRLDPDDRATADELLGDPWLAM